MIGYLVLVFSVVVGYKLGGFLGALLFGIFGPLLLAVVLHIPIFGMMAFHAITAKKSDDSDDDDDSGDKQKTA